MTRFAEPFRRLAVLAVAPMLTMAAACGGAAEGDASGGKTFVLKVTDGANAGPLAVGKRDGSFDEALAPLGARVEWVEAAAWAARRGSQCRPLTGPAPDARRWPLHWRSPYGHCACRNLCASSAITPRSAYESLVSIRSGGPQPASVRSPSSYACD